MFCSWISDISSVKIAPYIRTSGLKTLQPQELTHIIYYVIIYHIIYFLSFAVKTQG